MEVRFPLYILIVDPSYSTGGNLVFNESTMVVSGGPPGCMTLFSDRAMAEEYARRTGASTELVTIDTHAAAAEVARWMKRFRSCTSVGLNPQIGVVARVPTIPIDAFIAACEPSGA